ncbi:MAG TPA: 3-hydroxyacyl-CoA dehydrogenase family protein [Candidatus Woesebacteria bacterium]|nr:3-hydroxyacyl-CoA dehydrogenase family protein [Candidatus Woesebacteria bacterium]
MKINTVTIFGANGSMGSQSAGIIAGFGNAKIYMVARDLTKAQDGISKAIDSIKSEVIKKQLIPKTYQDLEKCISESDWIFECASEDLEVKQKLNDQIAKFKSKNSIVSTVSSGLSISNLAKSFDKDTNYFGTHFYNPPYKMLLCELISSPNSDLKIQKELFDYLQNVLHRKVVITNDTPGFAGNRIGFQLLNESLQFAEKYQKQGGIALIDYLLGGFTGRSLSPIATIDLVGLDVHKAIVDNIYDLTNDDAHESFKMPEFVDYLISNDHLGNKNNQGFYKKEGDQRLVFNIDKKTYEPIPKFNIEFINQVKELISNGEYEKAFEVILKTKTFESEIIQYFFARYISYSLSLVGPVVKTKEDIDIVMAYGFNWLPPCALIDLIGGKEQTINLIKKHKLSIPNEIFKHSSKNKFYTLQSELDFRSFIKAN